MDDPHGVRVAGPLGPYAQGFAGELARLGYRSGPAQEHLVLATQLSGWLAWRVVRVPGTAYLVGGSSGRAAGC